MVLAEIACRFDRHMDGKEKQRADGYSLFLFPVLSLSHTHTCIDNRKRSNDYNSTRTSGKYIKLLEGNTIKSILAQNKKLS